MVMFDIDALPETLSKSRWWSLERFNFISFYRRDYLGQEAGDLKTAVADKILSETGQHFKGKVFLLTHPRYLGFIFNPVSFYFCVNDDGTLAFILADINNTPWNQRHCYVLTASDDGQTASAQFDKAFHISPFMPMDINYDWQFELKQNAIQINMLLYREGALQFRADMQLEHQPLTRAAMNRLPRQYPLQTLRVILRIYWQALRLWLKKVPFYGHPGSNSDKSSQSGSRCEDNQ
jgi:hypothetical protein